MIDRTYADRRCKVLYHTRTVKGELLPDERGTIVYQYESLGNTQILVRWDKGFTVPVFPGEIEVLLNGKKGSDGSDGSEQQEGA